MVNKQIIKDLLNFLHYKNYKVRVLEGNLSFHSKVGHIKLNLTILLGDIASEVSQALLG